MTSPIPDVLPLPCPFCNAPVGMGPWDGNIWVGCENDDCGVQPSVTEMYAPDALERWNRRSSLGEAPEKTATLCVNCGHSRQAHDHGDKGYPWCQAGNDSCHCQAFVEPSDTHQRERGVATTRAELEHFALRLDAIAESLNTSALDSAIADLRILAAASQGEDSARLDWLELTRSTVTTAHDVSPVRVHRGDSDTILGEGPTYRAAIDAAKHHVPPLPEGERT